MLVVTSQFTLLFADALSPIHSREQRQWSPNSQMFIVCRKEVTEEDLRETFGSFEEVEGMQIHKDRKNEFKELKGRYLPNHPRPLKVSRGS